MVLVKAPPFVFQGPWCVLHLEEPGQAPRGAGLSLLKGAGSSEATRGQHMPATGTPRHRPPDPVLWYCGATANAGG